jgi:hypothetical protein
VSDDRLGPVEAIRSALVERAVAAFEDASVQGLCCEGAWEAAVSAMRQVDLGALVEHAARSRAGETAPLPPGPRGGTGP